MTKCTCTVTPRERHLNRECPEHGDAAEQRRHQAAEKGRPRPFSPPVETMTDDEPPRFCPKLGRNPKVARVRAEILEGRKS